MAFKIGDEETTGMNEMNLIPLIDIMLVLMIIFLVTATVLNPAVSLNLPETSVSETKLPPKVIQLSVDKDAGIFWDDEPISMTEMEARFKEASTHATTSDEQPTIRLRADKDVRYETVAQVLATANSSGLQKIAFVNTN